ncbi:hypothetical protein ABU05_004384 [Escherichia fergusonii]|nr:hypothetical protein [Escherichia fergusonii]
MSHLFHSFQQTILTTMNMTKKEALAFLALNQPMPNDYDITQELIDKYDDVRLYFCANPAEEAIPLFLQSFGEGDGLGVYQLVEDFLYKCDKNIVASNIANILENPLTIKSIRYCCTLLAMAFPDNTLIKGLNISQQSDDEDTREMAMLSLKMITEECI